MRTACWGALYLVTVTDRQRVVRRLIIAFNTLPELWLGGTFDLPSRRRLGQGAKLHPSWWTSHHHAVQGLFTMIGRHRVARRLINVYWGTTLDCILPTKAAGAQARNQDSNLLQAQG